MKQMHYLILLIFAAYTVNATAADSPQELATLKESYLKARSQAIAPIDKKYLDALTALKSKFTKNGDLESALAVDSEIKTLQASPASSPQGAVEPAMKSGSAKKLFRDLVGTTWHSEKWGREGTFLEDGFFHFKDPRQEPIPWKITEDSKLLIGGGAPGDMRNANLSSKLDSFVFPFGPPKMFARKAPQK
ncbi:MAG: hypothetical protein JNJ83_20720 [Verrucomicrobiaceae bacterium]|nr:hypothetical protein [Verrucomicrobiaceae bacterium]